MRISRLSALVLSFVALGVPGTALAQKAGAANGGGKGTYRPSTYQAAHAAPTPHTAAAAKSGGWHDAKGGDVNVHRGSLPLGGGRRLYFGVPIKATLSSGGNGSGGTRETVSHPVGIGKGATVNKDNGNVVFASGRAKTTFTSSWSGSSGGYGHNTVSGTTKTDSSGSKTELQFGSR